MSNLNKPPRYRSFLLRLWKEQTRQAGIPGLWRFSLEDPHTGERRGFPSIKALVAALRQEMADEDEPLRRRPPGPKGEDDAE